MAVGAALLLAGLTPASSAGAQTSPAPPSLKKAAPVRDPNTVGIVGSGPDGGALPFINDIAKVVASRQETGPNGELALRVPPIVGRGGTHDIRDLLRLPGVDMAITQDFLLTRLQERRDLGDLKSRLVTIAKLFNEELHVIARQDIRDLADLAGQPVNLGEEGGSAESMVQDLLSRLGLRVQAVHRSRDESLDEMRRGTVAATAFLAAKPDASVGRFVREGGFRLIPVPFPADAMAYLPSALRHDDYPDLIPSGQSVETVAVGAVLVAYNWPRNSSRYRLLESFVDTFFARFSELQSTSRGPKWQEINLAATVPGWKRFTPAEQWLRDAQARQPGPDSTGSVPQSAAAPRMRADVPEPDRQRLFEEFLQWRQQQGRR